MKRLLHTSLDRMMYTMMHYLQWQLRHDVISREELEDYLRIFRSWSRNDYFSLTPMKKLKVSQTFVTWESPSSSVFPENHRARALFFPSSRKKSQGAPTLIILHALMSASDLGYRRIAAKMNQRGWNVLFPHLPFHYSRKPQGHLHGSLAISAHLIRTAETLRQAVQEIRQLLHWSREQGSQRLALLATSYGGWIASLLLSLETIEIALLLQPIINLRRVTFESPLAASLGSLLQRHGITPAHLEEHAHLTEPSSTLPCSSRGKITIIGGKYDSLAPAEELRAFASKWGAHYLEAEQGHFGYQAMQQALKLIELY